MSLHLSDPTHRSGRRTAVLAVVLSCLGAGPLLGRSPSGAAAAAVGAGLVGGSVPDTAAPAAPRDTFLDPGARELLRRVRVGKESREAAITHYSALARERISMGVRALGRDRLVYRRELAAHVDWRRDGPSRITVAGAREAVPIAIKGVRVPESLGSDVGDLAFDPANQKLLVGLNQGDFVRNPLARGSGADYRFASGDTTTIRLPDGRTVRLIELRVIPRRADFQLISGSFWVDSASDAVVEAVYRPARVFNMSRDLARIDSTDSDDARDVPGILKPIELDIQYIAVEYGLWDLRWWLPRLISFHAEASIAHRARFPLVYERSYTDYTVSAAPAQAVGPDTLTALARGDVASGDSTAAGDTATAAAADTATDPASAGWGDLAAADWKAGKCAPRVGLRCSCDHGECHYYRVVIPSDSAALLTSDLLPPSIYERGEPLLTRAEAEQIGQLVDQLPRAPWRMTPPRLRWGLGAPGLLRYNRVEGLSVGARVDWDLGRARADVIGRLGLGDLQPEAMLELRRPGPGGLRVALYRRLSPVSEEVRPFSLSNSLQALLFGVDDGDYYRAWGAELMGGSAGGGVSWRLFGERQGPASVGTQLSLRHLMDRAYEFRPNIAAQPATLAGADVRLRLDRGLNATGVRWGGRVDVEAATGDFSYARPGLTAYLTLPLPASLLVGAEASAGTTVGTAPLQRLWYLGGAGSLRGYGGDAAHGPAFWRARLELSNQLPAARLAIFSDAGWAGPRADFGRGQPLLGVGVGASFLDGLVRVDLAHALRGSRGWRLDLYMDGLL